MWVQDWGIIDRKVSEAKNMTDKLDILIIDDDEIDRLNVQHLLDSEGVNADVHEA